MPEPCDHLRQILELARAAKHKQKGETFTLTAQMSPQAQEGKLGEFQRCLLIVGGAGNVQCKLDEYRDIISKALMCADGLVLSGGTAVGIPGEVGAAAAKLAEESKNNFTLAGYIANPQKTHIPGDARYNVLIETKGQSFSPLEPIQGWIDVLALGFDPRRVRVLGIEGGPIARLEYRLALALGAVVAVIPGSGREADELLNDPDWSKAFNLIRLTQELARDSGTMRAFVRPASIEIQPERLERVAEVVHENYLQLNSYSDIDESRRKFSKLRHDFKESNRQQVLYAAEILASEGFGLEDVGEAIEHADNPITDDQRRRMAELEHGRWNIERLLAGWRYGLQKDPSARTNNNLVPWDEVSESIKKYDIDAITHYAENLAKAGFKIIHAAETRVPND